MVAVVRLGGLFATMREAAYGPSYYLGRQRLNENRVLDNIVELLNQTNPEIHLPSESSQYMSQSIPFGGGASIRQDFFF